MKRNLKHNPYYLLIIFLFGAAALNIAYAQTKSASPNATGTPTQSTKLSETEAQNIIDKNTANQIQPEITIPAAGAKISGNGVVIKGVATPGASVDILIQAASGAGGPILGKATSDAYGVWSYTLAPTLNDGSYSISVSAQIGNLTPIKSKPVTFSVSGSSLGSGLSISKAFGSSGNSTLIIIIAIIISVTAIVIAMVLKMAPRSREKAGYINKMQSWETPELLSLTDTQWGNFVDKMEEMRQYLAVENKKLVGIKQ